MKNNSAKATLVFSLCLIAMGSTLFASPIGNISAGRKYYVAARNLDQWSAGAYVKSGSREIRQGDIDTTKAVMYVGYDFLPWVTTYAKGGMNNTTIGTAQDDDYNMELGFGMRFNLLHHEILDPTLFEDRIMVNASWEFSSTQARRGFRDQDFRELQASVTLSIVNDVVGSKLFLPHSIGLFFGPTYSMVNTSGVDTRSDLGLLVGLEVFYTKRVSFHFSLEQIGSGSTAGLAGVHVCL